MKNYEEMSDFEINKLVAQHLHDEDWWHKYNTVLTMQLKPTDSGGMELRKFPVNYCKNPSDAWPIILESKFKVDPRRSSPKLDWMVSLDDQIYAVDKNPLRAAMICFLKIKDAENGRL